MDIPWKLVTAMRNILIHDYDDVKLKVVWKTAQDDLPPLIARLETYLAAVSTESSEAGGATSSQA